MLHKIIRWVLFSVIFSLAPLLASWLWAAANSKTFVSPMTVVSQGDLYLLASGFGAVGIGELIGINQKWISAKLVIGGFSALNIVLSVFLYAALRNSTPDTNAEFLTLTSFWLFAISCIVSTSCMALSEMKDA